MLNKVKKLVSIFLLTIYTSIAFGISINFHYCGGHLAKVSLLDIDKQVGCPCNPGDMPKDCCKDNLIVQKVDCHRVVQNVSTVDFVGIAALPLSYSNYDPTLSDGYKYDFINDGSRRSCPGIYLLNRVFRI